MTKVKVSSKSVAGTKNFAGKAIGYRVKRGGVYSVKGTNATIVIAGIATKPESSMTPMEKMELLSIGYSKEDLEIFKQRAELDYDNLAHLLSVNRATLINKRGATKFAPALNERIIQLADIYSYGYQVFEDEEKFNKWMFRENKALGGRTPYDICDNLFGREEVKHLIGRIEHGIIS